MALLLSKNEADCLVHQHKQNPFLSHLPMLDRNSPYRASGLVRGARSALECLSPTTSNLDDELLRWQRLRRQQQTIGLPRQPNKAEMRVESGGGIILGICDNAGHPQHRAGLPYFPTGIGKKDRA